MHTISLARLLIATIPVIIVLGFIWRWNLGAPKAFYATGRMFAQLLLIGYILAWIFLRESPWPVMATMSVMLIAASWISFNHCKQLRGALFKYSFISILIGATSILFLMSQGVLQTDPWYNPKVIIPLAGMCFANAMNSISITIERLSSELEHCSYDEAKRKSFNAGMIPITNSFFAVGLVSIPGMMTGQILSGTDPLIAARYQIMIMCMLFAVSGISILLFLYLSQHHFEKKEVV